MATEMKLLPGEQVAFELECDFIKGGNATQVKIQQAFATLGKIFGSTAKTKLVVTNKRVIQISNIVYCWCIPSASSFQVIMPHSVMEVGYKKVSSCCGLIKAYQLYFQGLTEYTALIIKKGDDAELSDYVAKFYAALNA